MLSNMTFLIIFAVFDRSPLDKLQCLVLIFAVLLSKFCNVSLCNYTVYLKFFDSLDSGDLPYKIVENLKFTPGSGDQHASPCQI